jgi:hypothetical protein
VSWPSFWGGLAGGAVGVIVLLGVVVALVELSGRREERRKEAERCLVAEDVLGSISESQLEQYLLDHFEELFPGWKIYDDTPQSMADAEERRPSGIRYRTKAGEIDMLCIDRRGDLVVVELKAHKPPDRVVAQVDRYVAWVGGNLAQPGQRVRGLIIARRLGSRLSHALSRRRGIRVWTYSWQFKFNKRPGRR